MIKDAKRLLMVAGAVAGAAGIALTGTAASMASPQISAPTTLRLLVHGGSLTLVNVAHAKAFPRTGDELILVQPVYAAAHPQRVIGHAYITGTFVTKTISPPAGIREEVTLVLRHGNIELAGVATGHPFKIAVTGGTGSYLNARDQAIVTTGPGQGNPASVTLTLLP
jgi:hypothetical protein